MPLRPNGSTQPLQIAHPSASHQRATNCSVVSVPRASNPSSAASSTLQQEARLPRTTTSSTQQHTTRCSTPISSGIRSRRNNAVDAFKTTTPCSIFQCSRTPSANRLTQEAETRQSNSFQHALVNQNVFVDSSCHFCSSPHAAQLHRIISSPSLCIMQSTYVHCF